MEGNLGQYRRRTGLSANAGPGTGLEWTPGRRRQERSACLTTGLPGYGQSCSPRIVLLQRQKLAQKRTNFGRSVREGFDFWSQGMIFWRVLVGARRSPASFLQGLAHSMVRWEVTYKGNKI